jgi:RNA polymerase sigma-70 factor (ECF subfamily)
VSQIDEPRAYLFTIARNLAQRQWKQARIVRLEQLADAADAQLEGNGLSPERIAAARQELRQLQHALAALSERARRIFILRKIEGMSQKEIARTLGVTETVVENEASRGLKAVLKHMTQATGDDVPIMRESFNARTR